MGRDGAEPAGGDGALAGYHPEGMASRDSAVATKKSLRSGNHMGVGGAPFAGQGRIRQVARSAVGEVELAFAGRGDEAVVGGDQ